MRTKRVLVFCFVVLLTAGSMLADEARVERVVAPGNKIVVVNGEKVTVEEDGILRPFGRKGGFLGVNLVEMTGELRKYFGVSAEEGVLVSAVEEGSPAAKAGLQAGDVIVSIDGAKVASARQVGENIRKMTEGQQVRIDVRRRGTAQQFLATITERETNVWNLRIPLEKREEIEKSMRERGGILEGRPGHKFRVFEVDGNSQEALERLREVMSGPEWKAQMEKLQDCTETQRKLEALEKRLRELEKRLK